MGGSKIRTHKQWGFGRLRYIYLYDKGFLKGLRRIVRYSGVSVELLRCSVGTHACVHHYLRAYSEFYIFIYLSIYKHLGSRAGVGVGFSLLLGSWGLLSSGLLPLGLGFFGERPCSVMQAWRPPWLPPVLLIWWSVHLMGVIRSLELPGGTGRMLCIGLFFIFPWSYIWSTSETCPGRPSVPYMIDTISAGSPAPPCVSGRTCGLFWVQSSEYYISVELNSSMLSSVLAWLMLLTPRPLVKPRPWMPWTRKSQWKAWRRFSLVLFIGRSLEGARRLFCRGPSGGTPSLGHALTACFLLLYMVTVGLLYVTVVTMTVVWTQCPRHVAARRVLQTALCILSRVIQQCMHLILQEFLWWQLVQAQGNKWHSAGMAERLEGDSSGEYVDAREGSGSSSRVTEERVTFDRLGQRVHEPSTPPPGSRLCPPPPQPLSAVREVSHAVAIAVGRALGMEGRADPGLVVAHVPPFWESMNRVAIHLTTFSPTDWSHPHMLEIGDDPSPTMALDTTGSPTPPDPDAAPATAASSLPTATTTTSVAAGGLDEEGDPPPMAGMLPESREARRARWSRFLGGGSSR